MPDLSQVHIDRALTTVSVQFHNDGFVADQIFVPFPVEDPSDDFFVWGKDNLRSVPDTLRPLAKSSEIEMKLTSQAYKCDGHGLSEPLADELVKAADLNNFAVDTTMMLTEAIALNREMNARNVLQSGLTPIDLSSGANQFDNTSADPVTFIDKQKETIATQIGRKPNVLMLSRAAFRGLRNNPNVKSRISGAPNIEASLITAAQLAAVLEVEQVLVAEAVVDTAKQGQTDVMSYVWQKDALLFYRPKNPGLRTVSLGYQFLWNYVAANGTAASFGAPGVGVRQYRDEARRALIIEALRYYDLNVVAASAGAYFINAVVS